MQAVMWSSELQGIVRSMKKNGTKDIAEVLSRSFQISQPEKAAISKRFSKDENAQLAVVDAFWGG